MASDEIVDPTGNRQRLRRATAVAVGTPILGVGLVIVAILLITLHSYRATRAGALSLSNEMLGTLQEYVAEEVASYLEPAIRSAQISRDILAHDDATARQAAFLSYAASVLRQVPQVEAFALANSKGEAALVRRAPDGGTVTGSLRVDASGIRRGDLVTRDPSGHEVSSAPATGQLPGDADPERQDWFRGAVARKGGIYWAAASTFPPTGAPVIAASFATTDPDGFVHVTVVDVALDALSRFVASLRVGAAGRAVIVDRAGHLIAGAAPGGAASAGQAIDPAREPVVGRAYDRFRVEGYGNAVLTVTGARWVTIAAPLPGASPDWVLMIVAPERDFAGFANADGRQNLLFSLVIVLLALVLAGLLIRERRRNDRGVRALALAEALGRDEARALASLAADPALLDAEHGSATLTETLAGFAQARRVGVWRLAADGQVLHCEDSFDRDEDGHVGGLQLARSELPRFFEALRAGEAIETGNAGGDRRTSEYFRLLMQRSGGRALTLVPLRGAEGVAGALTIEDAEKLGRARNVVGVVASLGAIRLRFAALGDEAASGPAADQAEPMPEDAAARDAGTSIARVEGADGAAAAAPADAGTRDGRLLGAYPAVSVMVLAFADTVLANPRQGEELAAAVADTVRSMQEITARHGLSYVKLVSHQLIAATGFTASPDPSAAHRLAEAALDIREMCLTLMARMEVEPLFRIGIDTGPAAGSLLGEAPTLFNLWGDAVRMAELMASTAPELGTIQTTEAAYAALRSRYLFRPRGSFYTQRTGVARCFLLAGRR